jgi:hypothetical protein
LLVLMTAIGLLAGPVQASSLDEAIQLMISANKKKAKAQVKVDKLRESAGDALTEYRALQQQIESLRSYQQQVGRLLDAQRAEIKGLEQQIEAATSIGREITPMMLRMLDSLAAFVELDVPFLPDERTTRIAELREMMNRADVADSEKFRRILEAYQIENDFGRTIEAYKGSLEVDGAPNTVNFLRIGRVVLVYLSQDGKRAGVWNQGQRRWEELSVEYRSSIKEGLRIAQKQTAPDLIQLPVFAPGERS